MNAVAYTYLFLCAFIAIWMTVLFVKEDLQFAFNPKWKMYQRKFPPNYRNPISWLILFGVACPIINLVVLMAWVVMGIDHWRARHARFV